MPIFCFFFLKMFVNFQNLDSWKIWANSLSYKKKLPKIIFTVVFSVIVIKNKFKYCSDVMESLRKSLMRVLTLFVESMRISNKVLFAFLICPNKLWPAGSNFCTLMNKFKHCSSHDGVFLCVNRWKKFFEFSTMYNLMVRLHSLISLLMSLSRVERHIIEAL